VRALIARPCEVLLAVLASAAVAASELSDPSA
jgi:hypothetical protein